MMIGFWFEVVMIEVLIKTLTQEYVPQNEFVFWERVLW